MRLSFKKLMLDFACQAAEKIKKMSHGVQVMPNSGIDLVSTLLDGVVLATAVKFGEDTDDVRLRNTLTAVSVVTSYNKDIAVKADDAVHGILITGAGIKDDVVLFKLGGGRSDNYHITASFEEGTHTDATSDRGVAAVALKLRLNDALFNGYCRFCVLHHSRIPFSKRVFSNAITSARTTSRDTS